MLNASDNHKQIVTVSKLNRLARQILESEIGQVYVTGEISNFVAAASGHWYFTLKDNKAQVKTAMFRGANRFVKFTPKAGDKVVMRANLSIYEARGDYQLIAEHIEPEGEGQLKQQYEELKLKLSKLGLFNTETKKSLPSLISKVGVITSSTGAALQDILSVMKRRDPSLEVVIYPSMVQGDQAGQSIVNQIELANLRNEVDILIVGRGGGSLEDLWAFNEEEVVHAIFNSDLPIISAVGHQVDVTLSDFAADIRAATPTAAGEIVSQNHSERNNVLINFKERLEKLMNAKLHLSQQSLNILHRLLDTQHPRTVIIQAQQHLDRQQITLQNQIKTKLEASKSNLRVVDIKLNKVSPKQSIEQLTWGLSHLTSRLIENQQKHIESRQAKLSQLGQLLNSVSPLATLDRGYSMTFQEDKLIQSVSDIDKNKTITTKLKDGEITSIIKY